MVLKKRGKPIEIAKKESEIGPCSILRMQNPFVPLGRNVSWFVVKTVQLSKFKAASSLIYFSKAFFFKKKNDVKEKKKNYLKYLEENFI